MARSGVVLNWNGLDRRFGNAVRELSKTDLLLNTIGEALVSSTIKRFDDEKAPDGTSWEKSSRAERDSGKTLSDKGNLKNSISYEADSQGVTIGAKPTAKDGTNVKYARIHQYGGKAGRGRKVTIPARPFIGISEDDKSEIGGVIADFVAGAFR